MLTQVQESELDRISKCPLWDIKIEDQFYEVAISLLRSALNMAFDKRPYSLKELREKYVSLWNERWAALGNKIIPISGPYWDGPKQGNLTSKKIFEFLQQHTVLHPIKQYNLILGDYTIQGKYALIRKNGKDSRPMVLIYHTSESSHHSNIEALLPTLSSLSRYLHVKRSSDIFFQELGIYHLPLLRGSPWQNKHIDEKLALSGVQTVLNVIGKNPTYYSTGLHCTKCLSKKCLEIIKNDK